MRLSVQEDSADLLLVKCAGEVSQNDFGADDPLAKLIGPAGFRRRVLLNFDQAALIDSSGVSWLIIWHKRCLERGGRLVIFAVPPLVDQVFQLLKMHRVLCIRPDEAAARTVEG